jgi:F420H(2)-dependent quinone reductase
MADSMNEVDVDRLLSDPRAMDELNQAVIKEFRANKGKVSGPMEGMPVLLVTMTGAKTGRTLTRPLCYSRDGDRIVIVA